MARNFKQGILLLARLFATFVVMLIAFVVSTALMSTGSMQMSPDEASQAGLALLVVSLVNSLVLAYLILRSREHGVRLVLAVFAVHFGIETFMTQIETMFFNSAVAMPMDILAGVIASGLVRALAFAPLAVLVLNWRRPVSADADPPAVLPMFAWVKRLAFLAVVYAVVYFVFGYFVAWQSPDVRLYYSGTTDILPFQTHLLGVVQSDPGLSLFQLFRGILWAALGLLIARTLKGKALEISLFSAVAMAALIASGLAFPNPYMPAPVRAAHFLELSSSMLTFGAIAGWLWTRSSAQQTPALKAKAVGE